MFSYPRHPSMILCVSVDMKLAVLSYSFAHLYNFSPWWSIPFRELCDVVHSIWCFALLWPLWAASAAKEAEMSIEATEKKVWICSNNNLVWCLFLWTLRLLTRSNSDVMSVYIDFGAMAWRLFVLVYKQESIGSLFCKFLFIYNCRQLSNWSLFNIR